MVKANRHPIAVLSDQNLFREGLVELLHHRGFDHVEEYTSSRLLLQTTRTPAVLLVDLDHTQEDTMTLLRSLRRELPTTHIVAIGSPPRQEAAGSSKTDGRLETPVANAAALAALAALAAAAAAAEHTLSSDALHQHRLWSAVTPRQRDVLRWLATGIDNETIARKLRIGERAVKAHLSMLLDNFGVSNRTQLALIADHAGLRPPRAVTAP